MNRRNFLKKIPEGMACSGVSMFIVGRGLQRTIPDKVEERWIDDYDILLWRIRGKDGKHSWTEFRDTVHFPNDGCFTRVTGTRGMFIRTKVTGDSYPIDFFMKCVPQGDLILDNPNPSDWA